MTPKQSRFIAEYLVDLNATEAAKRAGYSPKTAHVIGPENLEKPDVGAAVKDALARREARVEVKADDVLRELLLLAKSDVGDAFSEDGKLLHPKQMPAEARRAIAGFKVRRRTLLGGEDGDEAALSEDVIEVKWWDKVRGLELLGKHLGLYLERHQLEAGDGLAEALEAIWAKRRGK